MKAPKCRVCGVSEWRHVCGGGVPADAVRVLQETKVQRKPVTKSPTIKVTRKNKVTKRGRPKLGEVSLTAAEKMRRYREKNRKKEREKSGE